MNPPSPVVQRVALVTGGASGIGREIALAFAARGTEVGVVDLQVAPATAVAKSCGGQSRAFQCDVTDAASVSSVTEQVMAHFGRVDILVNCAGVALVQPLTEMSMEAWDTTLDINLKGTFLFCQSIGRHMLAAGGGRIVNVASQAATVGLEGHAAYCASKAGLLGLTRVIAVEWGGRGISANTVSPTVVLTDLGRAVWSGEKGEQFKKLIPSGRFARPEEIAAVVVFLAGEDAGMINGADILVDGGYTAR